MARKIKTSQKIRVILNGVVIYTRVGAVADLFGGIVQREAVLDTIQNISLSDVKCTGMVNRIYGYDVQVDLL